MGMKDSLLGLVVVLAWGFNFVVIAIGLQEIPPLLMGGIRFLLVASVGCLFVKRSSVPLKWWLLYALPMGLLQFVFLFVAMANGMPSGLASLVLQAQALFTMLLSVFFLKERVQWHQITAISLAGIGLFFIANDSGSGDMTFFGFVMTIIAAISWALGNVSARTISNMGYQANVNLVIWSSWVPPIPFFILSYVFEGPDVIVSSLVNISWSAIGSIAYVAVIATIVGYTVWGYLLGRYPASQVAPLTLGVPVVGLTASTFIMDEVLLPYQWLGVLLVLVGLLFNAFGPKLKARLFPCGKMQNT